jgi:hypothetical protein
VTPRALIGHSEDEQSNHSKEKVMNCNCDAHKMHICYLKAQGLDDCIRSISDKPAVECRQCGAKANGLEYICAAHLGEDAPNVEGGHGSVGFDEVGKSHAGDKTP